MRRRPEMDAPETFLLNYDVLSSAERAEADAYLAGHPDAQALVEEGRALRAVLDEASQAGVEVPDAEDVARYVAAQYFGHHPLPADLASLGRRVEAAFGSHPEIERQYSIMRDRLDALTEEAESPLAQFERLVGYGLDAPVSVPEPPEPVPIALDPVDKKRSWRAPAADRSAVPLLRRVSLPRLAIAASFVVALVYGGLFLASQAQYTAFERLAQLDDAPAEYEGLRLRGVDGLMDPAAERYANALDALRSARSSTLGLFTTYSDEGLSEALALLREVTELEASDAALGLDAWFLIGQILLYQGDVDAAREAFQIVVDREGPSAPDAQRLLDGTASLGTRARPPAGP